MGAQDVGGCTWVPHLASHLGTHQGTSHKDEPRMLPELQRLGAVIGSQEFGGTEGGQVHSADRPVSHDGVPN